MNVGNVHSGLKVHAKNKPDKIAVVYQDKSLTFRELHHRVNSLANSLLEIGAKEGDHIVLYMRNRLEMMEALYAVSTIGAVVVPINYMVEGESLAQLINQSDAKYIFVETEQLQKFEQITEQLKFINAKSTIVIGAKENQRFLQYEDLMANGSEADPEMEIDSSAFFAILFSSGTTSSPKGSLITHEKQIYRTLRSAVDWNAGHKDVVLITVPIYHSVGFSLIFRTCILGSKTVITREFDPEQTLKIIGEQKITQSFFVPTQYRIMLETPNFDQYDLSSLKLLISAGAPLAKELKGTIAEKFQCGLLEFFGSTETGAYIILQPEDVIRKTASVGQQVSHMEVRLLDEKGNDVGIGEEGEFTVRGSVLFNGYYNNPKEMEKAFLPGGWFRTGDMGKMDEEGFYYLLDRKKDMIISGGVNVYPKDIEQVIYTHQAVLETAVIGIPDEKWGEAPKAFVV